MNRAHPAALVAMTAVAAFAVVTVVAVVLTVLRPAQEASRQPTDVPLGAALSEQDRAELAPPPVGRGAGAPAADPRVDLTDPEAVARAYVAAARSVTAEDAGRTHLRAAPYAQPGSPPATVGVLVLDAPPPGVARTATVEALELVAAVPGDRRRGYVATVRTSTGDLPETTGTTTTYVALTRLPDGRWLVSAESPEIPAGEDQ
ncbi:MAG TPA: hypothetical protein VD813_04465 [Pseudonocardia sp.]|nr:hypothetical protein [Pseudonocardia sp.]